MRPDTFVRLSRLLGRLASAPSGPHREVRDYLGESTEGGAAYDLYEPARAAEGLVIAAHGVTVHGEKDARLVHFARCLARARLACAVPRLGHLAKCRFDPEDLDALASVTRTVAARLGRPASLVGFSVGGAYALLVAGRTDTVNSVRYALTFGAYYSLSKLFDYYVQMGEAESVPEDQFESVVYARLTLAAGQRQAAGLPEEAWPVIDTLLERYCDVAPLAEKRNVFEKYLRGLDVRRVIAAMPAGVFTALSPAGRLASVACPVSIVHDPLDAVVPLSHAEQLHAELASRSNAPTRLLTTRLLSHVRPQSLGALREAGKLLSVLESLIEQ